MTVARVYADRDTWITEASVTSNFGASPILEIWEKVNLLDKRKQFARILTKFTLSSLSASIINDATYPDPRTDSSVSAFVVMRNAKHGQVQADDFTLWAFPLTATWTEGKGLDNDNYSNTGYADAVSATKTQAWNDNNGQTGGNAFLGFATGIYDSNSATQYFENGQEDLKLDVTDYFKAYLNYSSGTSIADGGSADHGFLVRMSNAQACKDATEAAAAGVNASVSGLSFWTKKFYARETNTRKAPYFQLERPGSIKDDRGAIRFSKSGNLYYFSLVDGVLTDLNGTGPFPGHVTLSAYAAFDTDSITGLTPAALTASRFSKGVYRLQVGSAGPESATTPLTGINLGLSSATSFSDSWTVTTAGEFRTDTFDFTCILPTSGHKNYTTANYQVAIADMKDQYPKGSTQRIRVLVTDKTTQWEAVTGSSTAAKVSVVTDGTVSIRETVTDDVEVEPFAISYDENGNFFDLDTNLLYDGMEYKIVLKLNVRGNTIFYDRPDKWSFVIGTKFDVDYKAGY